MELIKKHKSLIIMIITFLVCSGVNILLAYVTGNFAVDLEVRKVNSYLMVAFSFVYIVIYFLICLLLRIKKQKAILSGLLLYQFLAVLCFIIHLLMLMAGEESWLSQGAAHIFCWWSLPYHEAAVWFMNLMHFHIRYILMIFVCMMCYVTAKSLNGIKVDNAFEKKIQEKKEAEAVALEESKKHRITTAEEIERRNNRYL